MQEQSRATKHGKHLGIHGELRQMCMRERHVGYWQLLCYLQQTVALLAKFISKHISSLANLSLAAIYWPYLPYPSVFV